jgi:hypothetical protein
MRLRPVTAVTTFNEVQVQVHKRQKTKEKEQSKGKGKNRLAFRSYISATATSNTQNNRKPAHACPGIGTKLAS